MADGYRIGYLAAMRTMILMTIALSGCATVADTHGIHLLDGSSTLVTTCEKIAPLRTDTRGGPTNFDAVALEAFTRKAKALGADSAVITYRQPAPMGRIVLEGAALDCYD